MVESSYDRFVVGVEIWRVYVMVRGRCLSDKLRKVAKRSRNKTVSAEKVKKQRTAESERR